MIGDRETELVNDMAAILKKYDLIGFAGTFRGGGAYTTIKIEHPAHRDGACIALGSVLEHYVQLLGYSYGEWDRIYSGKWPQHPGSGEMPT